MSGSKHFTILKNDCNTLCTWYFQKKKTGKENMKLDFGVIFPLEWNLSKMQMSRNATKYPHEPLY